MDIDKSIFVEKGLYRHYNGSYYYLTDIITKAGTEEKFAVYFNFLQPELGNFCLELCKWYDTELEITLNGEKHFINIKDYIGNVTGQIKRFERIHDIDFQVKDISTEQLLSELDKRGDSPFKEYDIEKLNSKVVERSYICALILEDEITNTVAFETKEEAEKYKEKHEKIGKEYKIFKRIFVEE